MNAEALYHDHSNLLASRAWNWARKTGQEFSDCLSVCHEAFMEAVAAFVPGRGSKFSSFLATCCNQKLNDFVTKYDRPGEFDQDSLPGRNVLFSSLAVREMLETIEGEVKELALIILEAPEEVLNELHGRKASRATLRHAVTRIMWTRGWSRHRVRCAMFELDKAVEAIR